MKLLRTTALTAALMTAAVPSLTTPADAWGWGWRGGWGWGGVPYGYPAYYGYGFAYPAYGYGSGYYGGYRYVYHPVRRHCYGAFCDLPLPVLVAAGL